VYQEKSPTKRASQEMDGNKDNYENKKFQVDIGQITKDFIPAHTAEEKEEKNQGEEKDYSKADNVFSHDESSILSSEICQVNAVFRTDYGVFRQKKFRIFRREFSAVEQ
jgi:hypothetical protein